CTERLKLQGWLGIAKEVGVCTVGTTGHAKESYLGVKRDRPWLIVIGNEEKGMRRLTAEACDVTVGIPPLGDVTSLNASVAAGVPMPRIATLPAVDSSPSWMNAGCGVKSRLQTEILVTDVFFFISDFRHGLLALLRSQDVANIEKKLVLFRHERLFLRA